MGNHKKSPAKLSRSIIRLLEYKKAYLEDFGDCNIYLDEKNKKIIWKASSLLNLTLKSNVKIVETRGFYNPAFPELSFCEKLGVFQNMCEPDHDSFNFFACMHDHYKRKNSQSDHFCGAFSSPQCGCLTFFLSTDAYGLPYKGFLPFSLLYVKGFYPILYCM